MVKRGLEVRDLFTKSEVELHRLSIASLIDKKAGSKYKRELNGGRKGNSIDPPEGFAVEAPRASEEKPRIRPVKSQPNR